MNEYLSFRTAHGIDTKEYKDIYLGDYFKIQDGTYNDTWMVAHFDYYNKIGPNAGQGQMAGKGIVLILKHTTRTEPMQNAQNGYKGTYINSTALPAMATALSTVLGTYLSTFYCFISSQQNTSIASMAGAGWSGAASNWEWVSTQCILPSEPQLFGTTVGTSSIHDIGESANKFAVYNFINLTQEENTNTWTRCITKTNEFVIVGTSGVVDHGAIATRFGLKPIIYIT